MSNRECNYCVYQRILSDSRKKNQMITVKHENGGVTIYVNNKWTAWFMELPDHCCC